MSMKLEDQVVSPDLAKKLKALGVGQESAFFWQDCGNEHFVLQIGWLRQSRDFAAFTVAELGEMLPAGIVSQKSGFAPWVCHRDFTDENLANTEADARAKMLIYLIEQGIVKP